jgi:hypothetical protein
MLKQLAHNLFMDNTTPTVCDPRPFIRHQSLAMLWCQYNGQRATAIQVSRVMRQLTADDLVRMLTERRVDIAASLGETRNDRSEDCNCGMPNPTPGRPFDCPMHGPRE